MFLARKTAILSTKHPFLFSAVAILPSLIALTFLISTSSIRVVPPTLPAYLPRNVPQIRLYHALLAAKRAFPVPAPKTLRLKVHRAKLSLSKSLVLILGPLNITRNAIRRINDLESLIVGGQWKRFCWFDSLSPTCMKEDCAKVLSALASSDLYGIRNERGEVCRRREDVSQERVEAFEQSLKNSSNYQHPALVAKQGDHVLLRSIFQVGEPFEGFKKEQTDVQEELYESWVDRVAAKVSAASTAEVPSVLFGLDLLKLRVGQQVSQDTILALPAVCLVFGVLWWHTGSFFLSCVSILQILLAFPIAYVIYTHVFRQAYFSALQIFAIFLLLGIGADDVFVFTDAWKQAPVEVQRMGLKEHMEWTYHRAVTAMLTTTVTTAVAFLITATSPIMPMSTFGVWAAVLIFVQFLMVITVYPCALIVWQRHLREKNCPWVCDWRDGNIIVCTMCIPQARRLKISEDGEMRGLEQLFHGVWVRGVRYLRIPLVLGSIVILGTSVHLAFRLEPPSEEPQFLSDSHPLTVAKKIIDKGFRSARNGRLIVGMTWGILDINREGTSRFHVDTLGEVVIDESFDLKQDATQRHIAQVCEQLRNDSRFSSSEFSGSARVTCWIEDFMRWKRYKDRSEFETYDNDASLMFDVLSFATFRNTDDKQPFVHYVVEQTIMISTDLKRVVSCGIQIISPNSTLLPYQDMGNVYNAWQDKLAEINALGPQSANRAFVTGGDTWIGQVTQQQLVSTMMRSIVLMILVTTFTLSVTTLNVGVSFIATLCLSGIISSLLAMIFLLGWHLGVTESIIITMAMGYSFDGIAHIAMAYTQSAKLDRFSRTQDALSTLGISIVYGAISTLCSAAMLLPASVLVFSQMAKLVIITISLTLVWSLLFLPAFLLLIGPQNEFLSLRWLLRCCQPRKTDDGFASESFTDATSSDQTIKPREHKEQSTSLDDSPISIS